MSYLDLEGGGSAAVAPCQCVYETVCVCLCLSLRNGVKRRCKDALVSLTHFSHSLAQAPQLPNVYDLQSLFRSGPAERTRRAGTQRGFGFQILNSKRAKKKKTAATLTTTKTALWTSGGRG